jgi:hypothetical protein
MSIPLVIIGGLTAVFFYHFKSNNIVSEFNVKQFSEDIRPVGITIFHKLIYLYSFCQIQIVKIKKYICDDNVVHNSGDESMEILHNNSLVFAQTRTKRLDYKCIYDLITTSHMVYDLAIYTNANNHKICYNKITDKTNYNYELSDIKFISINVTYNDANYTVNLQTDDYNYYVVNNTINNVFVKYYLKHILKIEIDNDFKYKLELIDNNACVKCLEANESIIIQKNEYKIENANASIDIPVASYDYVVE